MNKLACILLIVLSIPLFGQTKNRLKHGLRSGRWIVYHDSSSTQIDNTGRYRKGIPKGRWYYYDASGHLSKTEKYRFNTIYTSSYFPNGNKNRVGRAKIKFSDTLMHFYYQGKWKQYNEQGELIAIQYYQNGERISEQQFKSKNDSTINDSLVDVLRTLNNRLLLYSDSLRWAEQTAGPDSKFYGRYQSLSNLNGEFVLAKLDTLFARYGYPGKRLTGKEYGLAFSIVSIANLDYKKKHLAMIEAAADAGELDWSDVAFFVDKIAVGSKQLQEYGTQYVLDEKNFQLNYYPIRDKRHLNERRKKVGLDEVDLSKIADTQPY